MHYSMHFFVTLKLKKHTLKIMKYLILLLFSATLFACGQQEKNCSKFKKGTFEYVDDNGDKQTIIRSDSIQIEFNDQDNIRIITSIEWVSECEYILTYKDIENYPKKDQVIGKKINAQIIKTNNNTFICHIVSNSINSKIRMVKID